MTHKVHLVFAGDVVTDYLAAQTRAAEDDGGRQPGPGLRAAGLQDGPTRYVDVRHTPGTHYPAAAAQSAHFGAYVHDQAERNRLWTTELCERAARVVRANPPKDAGQSGTIDNTKSADEGHEAAA